MKDFHAICAAAYSGAGLNYFGHHLSRAVVLTSGSQNKFGEDP